MTPLLSIKGLDISAASDDGDVQIINDLNFHLNKGEILGLVGESGCGKSVTMDAVLGLLGPGLHIRSGEIDFADQSHLEELRHTDRRWQSIRGRRISMIFQEPMSSFSPLYTIGAQIGEVLKTHLGFPKAARRSRILDLLDKVGIPEPDTYIDRYPFELSGGLRQRAMIAKALACNPELLIADEPTTALDVTIQAEILTLLKSLVEDLGMAMVFISHDLAVISSICHRVSVMYAGSIIEDAPVNRLFSDARHPYTRALLATLPGRRPSTGHLATIPGAVPAPESRPSGCPFHPRCDLAIAGECDRVRPLLAEVADDHLVACPVVGSGS